MNHYTSTALKGVHQKRVLTAPDKFASDNHGRMGRATEYELTGRSTMSEITLRLEIPMGSLIYYVL